VRYVCGQGRGRSRRAKDRTSMIVMNLLYFWGDQRLFQRLRTPCVPREPLWTFVRCIAQFECRRTAPCAACSVWPMESCAVVQGRCQGPPGIQLISDTALQNVGAWYEVKQRERYQVIFTKCIISCPYRARLHWILNCALFTCSWWQSCHYWRCEHESYGS
jgi:hypothetical protein